MKQNLTFHTTLGPKPMLGRIAATDFRDKKFLLAQPVDFPVGIKHYNTGTVLDQGQTSQCVAYSGEQLLLSGSVVNKMYKTPAKLYKECQQNDEWDGEAYEGTSVRALFKVLQLQGFISEYSWAFNLITTAQHVFRTGPVVFGTNWYTSMFNPDSKGFIRIKSGDVIEGGHAYLIKGINTKIRCPGPSTGAFRIVNSWGTGWGDGGFAWLPFVDAERLLAENGEAGTGKELKVLGTTSLEETE